MVSQTQSSPSVGQEPDSIKKHKLVDLDELHEGSYLGPLAPIATQVVERTQEAMKKAEEVYAVAKPAVDPVISFVNEQHNKHPEAVKLVAALVAVLYGGCFFNCAVLYATWMLADTKKFVDEVRAAYTGTGKDFAARAIDTLRKSDPADLMKLLKSFCAQFCIYSAVLYNSWATAAVLAIFVEEQISFLRPLAIAQVKPMVETDEMQRWIPMGVNVGAKAALTLIGIFSPHFVAALLFSFEGGIIIAQYASSLDVPAIGLGIGTVEEMSDMAKKTLGLGLACVGALYQSLYGFEMEGFLANIIYTLFFPIFVLEGMF